MSSLFHPATTTVFFPQRFNLFGLRSTKMFPLTLPLPRVGPILAGRNWRVTWRKGNRKPKKEKQPTKKEEERSIKEIEKRRKREHDAKIAKDDYERLLRDIQKICGEMGWANMSDQEIEEFWKSKIHEIKKALLKSYHEERKKNVDPKKVHPGIRT